MQSAKLPSMLPFPCFPLYRKHNTRTITKNDKGIINHWFRIGKKLSWRPEIRVVAFAGNHFALNLDGFRLRRRTRGILLLPSCSASAATAITGCSHFVVEDDYANCSAEVDCRRATNSTKPPPPVLVYFGGLSCLLLVEAHLFWLYLASIGSKLDYMPSSWCLQGFFRSSVLSGVKCVVCFRFLQLMCFNLQGWCHWGTLCARESRRQCPVDACGLSL